MQVASYFTGPAACAVGPPAASRTLSVDLPMSRSASSRARSRRGVAEAYIAGLQARGDVVLTPDQAADLINHFETLPTRYALDVNIESLDVLSHKRLLEEARGDPATVSFAVRPVEVLHAHRDAHTSPEVCAPGGACMRLGWSMHPSVTLQAAG